MNVRFGKPGWFALVGLLGVCALTLGGAVVVWAMSCCGGAPAISNSTAPRVAESSALLTGKATSVDRRDGTVTLQVAPATAGGRSSRNALKQLRVGDTAKFSMTVGTDGKPISGTAAAAKYNCPMHAAYVSDKPGKCPHCGMDLQLIQPSNSLALLTGKVAAIDKRGGTVTLRLKPAAASERSAQNALRLTNVGDTVSLSMTVGANGKPVSGVAVAAKYVCPMHPDVVSDRPGRCPKCGMDLQLVQGSNDHSEH